MSDNHHSGRRAFRPGVNLRSDLILESRLLLSMATVSIQGETFHKTKNIQARIAFGGKVAKIRDTDLELWDAVLIGPGHILAKPESNGRVMLILDKTDASTTLAINPSARHFRKGNAHHYPPGATTGDGVLHIGDIMVTSGTIGQILATQTAELDGVITAKSTAPIDRISFYSYQPGAGIITGGDVNTFDAFKDINLAGGPGISIGRDLNWMQVGGNLNVGAGSTFTVGRDIGLEAQSAKGTDPGGQGAHVEGNMTVEPGGTFVVGRSVDSTFLVDGFISGASRFTIPAGSGNFIARGGITA
jgi:hypothetical protein